MLILTIVIKVVSEENLDSSAFRPASVEINIVDFSERDAARLYIFKKHFGDLTFIHVKTRLF